MAAYGKFLLGAWISGFVLVAHLWGADFPEPHNTEPDTTTPRLSPAEAVAKWQLPPGFQAQVFAAEPDVQNPIGVAWDTRGRLWVAENYTYSDRIQRFDLSLRDRVVILHDSDGDGASDQRRVFTDQVQMLTSVELGRGGVWLMCPPQLLFIPDANQDDVPDGPPVVVLDGFTVARDNYHNFANGLKWGPDGWLYGRCGHSCPGLLGVPGTPDELRVPIRGGMWRYHPERRVVEVLAHGTTNPWGHDWDRHGELFFINTVNGHLWHVIPGAHLAEQSGISANPDVFERIDTIADHYHFDTQAGWQHSRDGRANDLGGGHAHIGMTIYQGTQWPTEFRDKLYTLNMHGRRANVERLEQRLAGYVGRHDMDVFLSADPWFRGIEISTGPDGCGYVVDWSDAGECHEHTGVHRTSGRIYRLSYTPDGGKSTSDAKPPSPTSLKSIDQSATGPLPWGPQCAYGEGVLPKLWSEFRRGEIEPSRLLSLTADPDEHVRVWAVRLLTDAWPLDTLLGPLPDAAYPQDEPTWKALEGMAERDPSGLVLMQLGSTIQRIPVARRLDLARRLVRRVEVSDDPQLPALVWFGLIPVGHADPLGLAELASDCRWPDTTRRLSRFLASRVETQRQPVERLLQIGRELSPAERRAIVVGLHEALRGWHRAQRPVGWDEFATAARDASADLVRDLDLVFGSGRALDEVRAIVVDSQADLQARQAALRSLIAARPDNLKAICEQVLNVRGLSRVAVRGLADVDDERLSQRLVKGYRQFHPDDRPAILEVLASRSTSARLLLDAVGDEAGRIPRADITPFMARQIISLGDAALNDRLAEVWGTVATTDESRAAAIAQWRTKLTADSLAQADLARGGVLFQKTCASCHRLRGQGGKIGPDLTGTQRTNLSYLLENILDPSGVVGAEYRAVILTMRDGRVLTGIVTARDARTLELTTPTDRLTIDLGDVQDQASSTVSLMPDNLLQGLSDQEVRDLLAYLMHPAPPEPPVAGS